jgi:MOSC domain-containing protein YiiM
MTASSGKLIGVYSGSQKGEGKKLAESAELIASYGIRGDSHAGRDLDRQVSLFASETLSELQTEGFEISAEELSANLITENIELNSLKPGTRLRIGEAIIEIAEIRKPCRSITKINNKLPKRLFGQCGQLGKILKGGVVKAGDDVAVVAAS